MLTRLRPIFKRPIVLLGSLASLGFVPILLLLFDGLTDSAEPSDVIIVLGNEVLDGGVPSDRLAARLDKAAELFAEDFAPHVVVSGGTGPNGFDEAAAMMQYLVDAGIPGTAITPDPLGVNTRATAINTAELMANRGWDSAIVVSQWFHISRTRLAHKQEGIENVSTASADYFELRDLLSVIREVPAYISYKLG